MLTSSGTLVVANVGDSRAVLCCRERQHGGGSGGGDATAASKVGIHSTADGSSVARSSFSSNHRAVVLSEDHIASDPKEAARIEALGGWIERRGGAATARVNGLLAVSRSLGDAPLKPLLVADPHVVTIPSIRGDAQTRGSSAARGGEGHRNETFWNGTATEFTPAWRTVYRFLIVATDGLWDVISSDDAVQYVRARRRQGVETGSADWQSIAMALTHEALLRGSQDNIGVCVIDLENRRRGVQSGAQ